MTIDALHVGLFKGRLSMGNQSNPLLFTSLRIRARTAPEKNAGKKKNGRKILKVKRFYWKR